MKADTDRAFRAFARLLPGRVAALVRRALGLEPLAVTIARLDDPNVDVPPHPKEADLVLRVGDTEIEHIECQGYRDPAFLDRVFFYQLALALRYPEVTVHSTAIWTRVPTAEQRAGEIRRSDITITVTHIVLPEIAASVLLASPETACFAIGGALDGMTVSELCDAVAKTLAASGAGYQETYLAAMVAASQKRYPELVRAMERAHMQPVIIEDLVDYGFDQGLAQGVVRGRIEATREGLYEALAARRLHVDEPQRDRIDAEESLEQLRAWRQRAFTAATVAEVLSTASASFAG